MAPLTRNLTQTFVQQRLDQNIKRQSGHGLLAIGEAGQALLGDEHGSGNGPDGDAIFRRASLPPEWVDSAVEVTDDIKSIQKMLGQLAKAEERRLRSVFQDDAKPDPEVEALSSKISSMIRKCEQSIHDLRKATGNSDEALADKEFRHNMQRKFASQLQQVSKQCREQQRGYLNKIRSRQAAHNGESSGRGAADVEQGEGTMAAGLELDEMEAFAGRRNAEVSQIAASVDDLNNMFRELANMVIDQGTILDRIDFNMEQMVVKGGETNVQLQKAEKAQKNKDARAFSCMLGLGIANVILLIVLMIKYKIKYGAEFTHMFWTIVAIIVALAAFLLVAKYRPDWMPGWCKWCPLTWLVSQDQTEADVASSRFMTWVESWRPRLGMGAVVRHGVANAASATRGG